MSNLEYYPFLKKSLGALLLVAGLALGGFLLFALGKDLSLWIFGQPVTAQVIDRWTEATNEGTQEELTFRYFVRYRFSTPDGRVIFSTKTVAAQEWVGVGHGSRGRPGVDFYDGEAEGPAVPVYREQEHLSEFVEGGMISASEVTVVYFPLYPAHNRLEETRYVPLLACTYVPLLAMAALSLLGARHLLRRAPSRDRWDAGLMAALSAES